MRGRGPGHCWYHRELELNAPPLSGKKGGYSLRKSQRMAIFVFMQQRCIRSVFAGLTILLFAFSITPKIMLHDLVANHKDRPFTANDSNSKEFDVSGFHCHVDNLVVESPFLGECLAPALIPRLVHKPVFSLTTHRFHFTAHFYFALRGPPAVC